MAAINAAWHDTHVLPRSASLEKRIAWHREHQKRCGCRPVPPKLLAQMTRDAKIDTYVAKASTRSRSLLTALRKTIHSVLPDAEECISYGLPAFRHDGKVVAGFAATKNGGSYYPFSGRTLGTLARDVKAYGQTKGALHFDKPLPVALVRKLLEARIAEAHRR